MGKCDTIQIMARATLTPKRQKFVQEYVKTKNATEAAVRAFDITDNNRNTARAMGAEVLAIPSVRAQIEGYAKRAAERVEALAESAKSEYVKLQANVDILDRAGLAPQEEKVQPQNIVIMISGDASGRYALQSKVDVKTNEVLPSNTIQVQQERVESITETSG